MHTYLESAGFKKIRSRREMDRLISDTVLNHDRKNLFLDDNGRTMGEFSREYAPDIGLSVCGEFDEEGNYHPEYSFPYFQGSNISSEEDVTFDKHAGKESYAGACEDPRVGVTVIFYLLNMGEFMMKGPKTPEPRPYKVRFSGMAREGTILLPIRKYSGWDEINRKRVREHTKLVNKARVGDEEAIESLTMEDIDLYSMIQKRLETEDVFSIVDTTFAPYGVECDQYSVVGTINSHEKVKNTYTGEEIWKLVINACDVTLDVCINAETLYGEPKEGRRFRGLIWLLGKVDF